VINSIFGKTEKPTKAEIIPLLPGGPGTSIKCMFNPTEYTLSKSNNWAPSSAGGDVPKFQFTGGNPAELKLKLLFDTYETGEDVCRAYTDKLWNLMMINKDFKNDRVTEGGRPPLVRFIWGESESWSFDAAITSMSQQILLFSEEGTPLRALVDLSLKEVLDPTTPPPQNPTSGGLYSGRQWIVKDGDSLSSIAYSEYGDATRWRAIADANRLVHVRRLRVGSLLEIPDIA
jgi:hypothetical protein